MPDPAPAGANWPLARRTSNEWMRGQETGATEYNAAGQVQQHTGPSHAFKSSLSTDPITVRRFRGLALNTVATSSGAVAYNAFEVVSGWTFVESDTTVTYDDTGASSFPAARNYTYGSKSSVR